MLVQVLLALALCSSSIAQRIGAFYTNWGATLVELDTVAGTYSYNIDSDNGFSSSMRSLPPDFIPKNGSSMATVGYAKPGFVSGAIFYQVENDTIAQQRFECKQSTGICSDFGGYLLSTQVTVPVKPNTGLSVSLLSNDLGYRLSYEDIHGSLRQLSYSNTSSGFVTPWKDGVPTSDLASPNGTLLSTAFTKSMNGSAAQQTIFQLAGDRILTFSNNNVTSMNDTQEWVANTPITNLPNWDPTNLTFSACMYNSVPMLFYIDTTRQVQWILSRDNGSTWEVQPTPSSTVWPLADVPNAPIAAAVSNNNGAINTASIFYISNGAYVQSVLTNGVFAPYSLVGPDAPSSNTTQINLTASLQYLRNKKAVTIGASAGASIGFVLVAALIAVYIFRKKSAAPQSHEKAENIGGWRGSELSLHRKPELDGKSIHVHELDHDSECLLFHQLQLYRICEMRGKIPVELQNSEVPQPELDHTLCKCELDAAVLCELPTLSNRREGSISGSSSKAASIGGSSSRAAGSIAESSKKNLAVSVEELPWWSWAILRREAKGKDEEYGGGGGDGESVE